MKCDFLFFSMGKWRHKRLIPDEFFFKMAIPDNARVMSESIGPIPTEIDLTGRSWGQKLDFIFFNMDKMTSQHASFRWKFWFKMANPDDARVNAEPEATDQSRLKSTLSLWAVSGSKKIIFYAWTWEYDVTSVSLRRKFLSELANLARRCPR
jgi:hypothetical protein